MLYESFLIFFEDRCAGGDVMRIRVRWREHDMGEEAVYYDVHHLYHSSNVHYQCYGKFVLG